MKTAILPGTIQRNLFNSDKHQNVRNFAVNISNNQYPGTTCDKLARWHFLSFILLVVLSLGFLQQSYSQVTQTFNSSGTFVVPAGVTTINVQVWGGGGRGGERTTGDNVALAGGGGGAYSMSDLTVTPGTPYTVTVGAGSSSTAQGGDSWFGSTSLVLAKGGGSVANNSNTRGAEGLASAGVGDVKYNGGRGAAGYNGMGTDYGGGGGSSAGTGAAGNYTSNQTTRTGGSAPAGGGAGGLGAASGVAGLSGLAPGGGGGGGYRGGTGSTQSPGDGADGKVVITYIQPPTLSANALTDYGLQCINNTYGPNSFTITGVNLTNADVLVGPLNGFTFSTSAGGTYEPSLTLTQPGGAFSQEIFVMFSPTVQQSYDGFIPVGGGGAPYINVAASASGVDNAPPAVTSPSSALITDNSASLGGDITFTGCSPVTERGIYWSTINGFADGDGNNVPETGAGFSTGPFTVPVTGLSPTTVYYYKAYAINSGGTTYSSQGTFTTLCQVVGDPSIFGSGEWNVYAYNGNSLNLSGTTYRGYYTETNLSFNTTDRWGATLSPSVASGYAGCPVNNDNFTLVYKRQGFTCGTYQIDLAYQDDDSRLYIDGIQVFEHLGWNYTQTNIWTGTLDATSTVEFRIGEGNGDASGALTFTFTTPEANFSASSTSVLPENPVVFNDLSTGNITSRSWTFTGGNPSSSTDQNPVVTYSTPGTYNVSLTVTSCGSDYTKTSNAYITVNALTNPITFSSNGLFPVPPGVTCVQVEAWGGGGRGGSTSSDAACGGGGGGAYSMSILSVTPGNAYSVTVGTGSTSSSAGGDSWFSSLSTLLAKGGNSAGTNQSSGASGGSASTGVGTTKYSGGSGAFGTTSGTDHGGGGGSSAGTGANGNNSNSYLGATAPTGGGDGGDGRNASDGNGLSGSTPGGGGGGALRNGFTNYNGGNGANGQVIISWVDASDFHTSAPTCIENTAEVTVTSTSLADGNYTVTYNTTNPATTGNTATMAFSGGIGTLTTIVLAGPSSDIIFTGITYTGWSCSTPVNSTVTVHIQPIAAISYAAPFCIADTEIKDVTQTGQIGGTYSAPAGLEINSLTGAITPNLSTAGTYTVTYSFDDGTCSNTATTSVTIGTVPVATFSYSAPSYCTNNALIPTPSFSGGGVGGVFTVTPAGLTLDPGTGEITLGSSLPGPYTVTNTVTINGCETVYSVPLIILNQPTVDISYAGNPFCNTITTPQSVTRQLTNGTTYASGSYTAEPAGLSINTSNDGGSASSPAGQIIPSESLPGTYTVTYTFTNGVCSNTQTTTVVINTPPIITEQPVAPAPICNGNGTGTISVTATDGSLTYQWRKNSIPLTEGTIYTGVNSSTLTISNPGASENGALFDVVVSGSCAPSATSNSVPLMIIESPTIEDQPVTPAAMCEGNGTTTISVTATGYGLTYQWRKNFVALTDDATYQNVTTSTLTITNPGVSENGAIYDVVVTGACEPVLTSGIAGPVIVNPSPVIFDVTGSAISCALNPSSDISLSGSQLGIDYQLRNSSDNSDIGAPISGDGNPITLPTGSITTTTNIIVVGIDPSTLCTTQMTGTATITVLPEITNNTISSQPTTCIGSTPDPIMGDTPQGGDGDYVYVWQSSPDNTIFVTADGINDNQNYLPDPLTVDTWFRRIVTSGPCTSISNSVQIRINPLPAQVDVTPPTAQFCNSITLTASNGDDGTIYYQGNVSGGQDTRFAQNSVVVSASGTYYFRAFNRNTLCWGPEGSATVTLSLPPSTLNTTICQGGSGTLISAAACPSATSVVPNYPGTAVDNAGVGTAAWGNPGNIITAGTPYTVASNVPAGGGITHYLMATNYNFNVPSDATINGIMVTINRSSTGNTSPNVRDNIVRLIRGGTIVGSNRAKTTLDWPITMGPVDYGNIVDTWGLTGLTASDINSPNFGVALSATNTATSTYPVVAGTATSAEENRVFTHAITLPSGIQSGDLLLIFWADASPDTRLTFPDDWNSLYNATQGSSGLEYRRSAYYKVADGTEGSTVYFTTDEIERSAHNTYRILAGTYQGIPVDGTVASGTSTSPNPPSLTSGFGNNKTLWIAAAHSASNSTLSVPTNYSDLIQVNTGTDQSNDDRYATMGTSTRFTETATEDPGAYTLSQNALWGANTVAIQGISGVNDATVDYIKVTVRYTVNGILNWYTSAVGGTSVQSGSPFNPIGDPEVVAVYPALTNSLTPGIYPFWAECSSVPGCRTLSNFTINPAPAAPVAGSNLYTYDNLLKTAEAIVGAGETVDWYADPTGGAPIAAPSGTNAGTYSGYAEARNIATGCPSLTRTLVTLTIEKRPVTITADPNQTKVYGDLEPPAFTYTVSGDGLATGDSFTGELQRDPGEDVGFYPINIGTLLINNQDINYIVTYVPDSFSITVMPITVTAEGGQTKVYGDAEPLPYTYTSLPAGTLPNGEVVSFTGVLTRAPGESVGVYAILQGTLDNSNYDITFMSANFTITALPVTVSVDPAQTKVYGAMDPPAFTFTSVPEVGSLLPDGSTVSFSGALERVGGEDIGDYEIQQGTLDNINYDITFLSADFTITPMLITVTADPDQTKVYGSVNPVYTYTSVPATGFLLPNGETVSFTGALSRELGEDVGSYAIEQGTLGNDNYSITFIPDVFTITVMPITVTADPDQTKVYGDDDPLAYTYTSVPTGTLPNGEVVSFLGELTRVSGENVGGYPILQGSLDNSNYDITFVSDDFVITALPVTVTADPGQTKVYGAVNPASYTYSSSPAEGSSLPNGDVVSFTGALTRLPGENVGNYAIQQGSLANSNYDITFESDDFTITAMPVTVTADPGQTKVYGAVNPAAYTYISVPAVGSALPNGDLISFTGALTRATGENVGNYAIQQGTLANANYNINFVPANFTITAMTITVTATSGQSKVYGAAEPLAFTYTSVPTGTLPNGDVVSFTGALNRVAGENVGSYPIQQGSLANTNYIINFIPADFAITAMPITVTPTSGQTKVYGAADPLAYTYTSVPTGTLPNGEVVSFTGELTRVSGENVGSYAIQQGTLANSNYTITFIPANFTITAMPVTVTADPGQTKVYGAVNPAAYTFASVPAVGSTLPNGDVVSFTGALSRVAGEDVGVYAITQGDLANANYDINFVPANFTITAMPITVTATSGQSKVYGAADPLPFAYTSVPAGTLPNGAVVSFTGALSRVTGEDVGSYALTQGTLANGNYTITFETADFAITAMPVTVTATAGQTKVYGAADPLVYTYTSVPGGLLPNGTTVSFTGALSRVAGEDVGIYAIQQGTLANSNYTITYVPANFTITPLPVTVTATAGQSKVFGSVDPPAFTYTSVPAGLLPNGTTVSFIGALSRLAGENVGNYAIQIGSLANSNYTITFVPANFTITAMAVTVTANPGQTKVYGTPDPASYPYTSIPAVGTVLANGTIVSFTGALTRAAGENAGPHPILQGTLANSNYNITFVSSNFIITPRPITVTADAKTKVYGTPDPALTYQITAGTLVGTDAFSGALTRAAGQNVGTYPILQGTLALNANYTITYIGANFVITTRAVTITADPKTKIYGVTDPVLTYQITSGTLVSGDTFSGALTRDPGQNVGIYAIRQGTLSLNSNYTLSFVGANLTIFTRAITVTANAQTKMYGTADPALTYRITSGSLVGTDTFTGSLVRDPGQNVGTYPIRRGSLALSSNYALTYVGANLVITIRPITITADDKTKVYGNPDPVLTYQITSGSLASGDSFTGALSRDPGEDAGTYSITQGNLGLSSNYNLTFIGADLTITTRAITVTANNSTKVYGDADNLTYQITSGTLAGTDTFSGSLSHDGGETVGTHPITQGSLSLGSNYTLTFVGATLTITERLVTVTADPLEKVYGDSDPMLTYTVTTGSLATGDIFTGALIREPGEDIGTYAISQGDLALNSNYIMTFTGATFTITQRSVTVTADPKIKIYGDPDPELTYHITSGNLAANGDAFIGSLLRDPGEDVGIYAITQGDLALSSNYILTFIGAEFSIVQSSVAITVKADQVTKVYGEADPELTYEIVSGTLVGTDTFTGELVREPGEDADTYAILQGTLALSPNYTLVFEGDDFIITRRPVTVTADAKSKVFGEADPELTYEITSGELVANGDAFTGDLTRESGEGVGTYTITQGTLSLGDNYDLEVVPAELTITSGFVLKAYPNPFADHIYFEFDLNTDAEVILEIFNIVGVKVATVFEGNLTADHYRFEYLPESLSQGVLIYKLTINGNSMVIEKAIHKK